jgi:transposase
MTAYVGVDWSASKVVCATGDDSRQAPRVIRGASPVPDEVCDLVRRVQERHPQADRILVFIEAGNKLWPRLFEQAGATVHVVDPKQVHYFAKSLSSSGAKDDRRDARTLVEFGRSLGHRLPRTAQPSPEHEVLLKLSRAHEQTSNELTKTVQRLRSALLQSMPEVSAVMRRLTNDWCLRLLECAPTPWHLERLTREELDGLMAQTRQETRDRLWQAVQRLGHDWLTEQVATLEARLLRMQIRRVRDLRDQLAELDQMLDDATCDKPERAVLESVKGIAMLQATALTLHAFSQPITDRDDAGIRMGVCPVFRGSAEDKHGQKQGSARLRRSVASSASRAGYLLGRLASQHLRWAKAMYQDGRARGQRAATVYRRIARSLLRILSAMVRNHEPYDEDRYIAALKSNGVSWAMAL